MMTARRRGRPVGGGMTGEEARSRILDAAERCFFRASIGKVTVDDIAGEADLSRSTIYQHFSGRDEILEGVITRMTDAWTALMAEQLDDYGTLEEWIVDVMVMLVTTIRSDPALVSAFSDDGRSIAGRVVGNSREITSRARTFAHEIVERAGSERSSEIRGDISIDEASDHLVRIGMALVAGGDPIADDSESLRRYVSEFVVAPLIASRVGERHAARP